MTKKNIQVVFAIFMLTILTLGGLYYFSQQSKKKIAKVQPKAATKQVERADKISDIDFIDKKNDKSITLTGVVQKNYRVRLLDTGNGFTILFPNTLSMLQSEYLKPLPWVDAIRFEQKQFRGHSSVEMTVTTEEGIAMFDQFKANSLVIGLRNTKAGVKKVAKKPSRKPARKVAPVKPKRAPAVVTPEPEPELLDAFDEELEPFVADDSDIVSGDDFLPTDDFIDEETPVLGDNNLGGDVGDEELSLMDVETNLSLGVGDEQAEEIAAIEPSNDGNFDMGTGVPSMSIQDMKVKKLPNGKTLVRFVREGLVPYKIFRKREPWRLVVDFKDAAAGFDENNIDSIINTSIQRVETKTFRSSDEGTLLRVEMFLDKKPEYAARKDGNVLILELP